MIRLLMQKVEKEEFLELVRKLRKTATYKIHRKRFYVEVLATKSQKGIF